MHLDREIEPGTEDVLAKKPVFFGFLDRDRQVGYGQGILLPNVDIALVRADGIGADHQPFKHSEWVAFHHRPVHVGPGVTLVAIDDHILLVPRSVAGKIPLHSRRETRTAAPPQFCVLHFADDLLGRHLEERLDQSLVPVGGEVVFQAFRVDLSVGAEDEPFLVLIEGDIVFDGRFLAGVRIDVEQALHDPVSFYRLGNDLGDVFRLHLEVADPLRINDDDGPLLAETVTTGSPEDDIGCDPLFFEFLFDRSGNLSAAGGVTGTAGTERNVGLIGIPLGKNLLAESFQFGR